MLSKSEKILMSLNCKQKPLYQLATAELFPNETGKQQKMTKNELKGHNTPGEVVHTKHSVHQK